MKRLLVRCAPLLLLIAILLVPTFTAQAATAKPAVTCTPNVYHVGANDGNIYDQSTHYPLGYVRIYSDGCGWIYAEVNGQTTGAYVNHLQIFSGSTLVYEAPYNGTNYNKTIHLKTNGAYYYAVGVIQVPSRNYWGSSQTGTTNGTN